MKENYDQALKWVLEHEGGYSNHPADKGGETNRGITWQTYDDYRRLKGLPKRSVKLIEDHEVHEIYRKQYANVIRFNELPEGLDYAVFDFAVNSGTGRAAEFLQRLVGVKTDRVIGVRTLAAVNEYVEKHGLVGTVDAFNKSRLRYVRRLDDYKHFGRGWEHRISQVIRRSTEMAERVNRTVAPPVDWTDVAEVTPDMAAPAYGEQTLTGSIADSKRSQGAVVGSLGVLGSVVAQVSEVAQPVQEAFAWSKYAALIGLLVAAIAFGFIIWHRSRSTG